MVNSSWNRIRRVQINRFVDAIHRFSKTLHVCLGVRIPYVNLEAAQLGGGVAIIDVLPEPVEEFHTLAERYGVKASYHQADITNQQSLESAFTDAVKAAVSSPEATHVCNMICRLRSMMR